MSRYYSFIIFLLCISSFQVLGQYGQADLEILHQYYRSFEYQRVIVKSDELLQIKDQLSTTQLLNIFKYRALAHYSLTQMDLALKDFIEIFKIDPEYSLDPMTTSPKIITFFNEIKSSLQYEQKPVIEKSVVTDTVFQFTDNTRFVRNAVFRSIVLPGWGHLYNDQKKKGWLFMAANAAAVGCSIYMIYDTMQKQDDYLLGTDSRIIQEKYEIFNKAYQRRNIALSIYAVYWAYVQTDLLLFSDLKPSQNKKGFSLAPGLNPEGHAVLSCTFHW